MADKIQLELGVNAVDCLWRTDGERYTRNEDGTYSGEKSKELQPTTFYRYSFKRLMDTGQFFVFPIEPEND
jgi:hypothetical protein